jgi:hypothetical protein
MYEVLNLEYIVQLTGKVRFPLTLDPGVWIFDDRKVDLTSYFEQETIEMDELEAYTKSVSEHWDRELKEGAIFPPINKSVKKFEKEKILTGSFAIPLKHFLGNAEPLSNANRVLLKTVDGEFNLSLTEATNGLVGFSNNGKPLSEDGPIHFYFGDGSNKQNPIKLVQQIVVE